MYQIIEQTEEDKFKMYSKLSKKELISMLIESNKHLNNKPLNQVNQGFNSACNFYMAGKDTSGKCSNCGKNNWEHNL